MEIYAGGQNAPLTLDGKSPNTMQGTWIVKAGRLVLAKPPGVDALGGTIIVSGQGDHNDLLWNGNNQINHAAHIQLLSSDHGTAKCTEPEWLQRHDRPSDAGCWDEGVPGGPPGRWRFIRA